MAPLRELTYREVTRRLSKLGFRFYRQGKGSHELWVPRCRWPCRAGPAGRR